MIHYSLGFNANPAPGTPVTLSSLLAAAGLSTELRAHRIYFEPVPTNTGLAYVGLNGLSKTTGAGCLKVINVQGTTGKVDDFEIDATLQTDGIRVANYSFDMANSTDKLLIAIEVL